MRLITDWFRRTFSDPQVVLLSVLLATGFLVVVYLGEMLAPVLASVVMAYLLEGLVGFLERRGWPRIAAVCLVFAFFVLFLSLLLFGVLPLVSRQLTDLIQQIRKAGDRVLELGLTCREASRHHVAVLHEPTD